MLVRIGRSVPLLALLAVVSSGAGIAVAENTDPEGDDSQRAYGENIGWLNAEPLGDGGPGVQVEDLELTGWMWGENVGWVSMSCANTASCGTVDYGVTNDGAGDLAGFAWAENVGWISMSCVNTASCGAADYGVGIDPLSGAWSGRAWAENVGWITFASAAANPYGVQSRWCSPPSGSLSLVMAKSGSDAELLWTSPVTLSRFDVVRGELSDLRASGGDFATAIECVGDDIAEDSLLYSGNPPSGDGFWFLVRADCGGGYDSGGDSQVGARDAEVAASGNDCD